MFHTTVYHGFALEHFVIEKWGAPMTDERVPVTLQVPISITKFSILGFHYVISKVYEIVESLKLHILAKF